MAFRRNHSFEGYMIRRSSGVPADNVSFTTLWPRARRGSVVGVAARGTSSVDQPTKELSLRLTARPTQGFLLRAHLRLWLTAQDVGEDEVLDILVAATEAFNNAVMHTCLPRSIAVHVDASISEGVVDLVVRDHRRWRREHPGTGRGLGPPLLYALMDTVDIQTTRHGTTVRLQRVLDRRLVSTGLAATTPARDRLDLLWRNPLFAPLPGAMRERLATQLTPVSASLDETIIREATPPTASS